jgi:hypothetical protein
VTARTLAAYSGITVPPEELPVILTAADATRMQQTLSDNY